MTELKSLLQAVLQDAGYQTWLATVGRLEFIGFEDDAVMGSAYVFESVTLLLKDWHDTETSLLMKHAPALQKAGEKSWNVYSVFLCTETATASQSREVRWIEEDLERTRKLTGCGLRSRDDLLGVLLPLLPIQYQPKLDSEDFDLRRRLRKRIEGIAPAVADVALDRKVTPAEVVRLLGEET